MVREIAVFEVQQGQGENFVESYTRVSDVLNEAPGSHGAKLHRGIENPDTFTLIVEWDSVEAHTALTKEPAFKDFGGRHRAVSRGPSRGPARRSGGLRGA